jgi:hypothetical protein
MNVSRQSVDGWVGRYLAEVSRGLGDRPHRPKNCHRPGGKREVAELVGVGRPDRAPVRGARVQVYGVGVGGDDQGVGMKVRAARS